ncbi:MAG: acyltransferase [Desulfobacteraceae bacterium]|jgi:acetyltransferase-like isoleucine patch superfamily enzyme
MTSDSATMTKSQLENALTKAVRYPHKKFRKGRLIISSKAYSTSGLETNLVISPFALLDCTGSIHVGPWCNIGARSRIYTHDTIHFGKKPLAQLETDYGVLWQDKYIGADVWIHDGAIILYQVTHIPDGAVVGAGSVLTKNPNPYEIWAGNPARKIGERKEMTDAQIKAKVDSERFRLNQMQIDL